MTSTAWTGRPLEAVVGAMLRERHWTIAVAESCRGGLLASRLTDVPGSSDYVERGEVCYSNRAKIESLGVPDALIAEHGAVSEPVARAMADGHRAGRRPRGRHRRHRHRRTGRRHAGQAGRNRGDCGRRGRPGARADVSVHRPREMVKFQSAQAALNMLRLLLSDIDEIAEMNRAVVVSQSRLSSFLACF